MILRFTTTIIFTFLAISMLGQNVDIKKGTDDLIKKYTRLYTGFSDSLKLKTDFNFSSAERKNFKRFPGKRNGIQISKLNVEEKILLHDILNDELTQLGYLKVLGVISNEDAPARNDDLLGREMYWITFFGIPDKVKNWGFRFEGHHISVNITYDGDKRISHTPFVIGAYPSIQMDSEFATFNQNDNYRVGYNILSDEEDLALTLYKSFDKEQREKAEESLGTGNTLVSENSQITDLQIVKTLTQTGKGLKYEELTEFQKNIYENLINAYAFNFSYDDSFLQNNFLISYSGEVEKNGKYYYRLTNEEWLIEYQSIGNHIHYIVRNLNSDFGNK